MTQDGSSNRLSAERRKKLQAARRAGAAYPNSFQRTDLAADLRRRGEGKSAERLKNDAINLSVAGRIMNTRIMGRAAFVQLRDMSGDIQLYIRQETVGEEQYRDFKRWDNGDIVGAQGALTRMKSGELSVRVNSMRHLVKCLRPVPEKYHGLSDIEERHRHRYLDLMVNPPVRDVFVRRSKIVSGLRHFFDNLGFLEVETPMMHALASGAAAKPFKTHHNALDMALHLRIAPELHLKRLVVGGLEKVYELNRSFRNEGVSARHNPEFTMLEFYQAYSRYYELMDLIEGLLRQLSRQICHSDKLPYGEHEINMGKPFARQSMGQTVRQHHPELFAGDELVLQKLPRYGDSLKMKFSEEELRDPLLAQFALFEKTIAPHIIQPTFITDYPKSVSPLARSRCDRPDLVERFELFVCGYELANGFSELNDPQEQKKRLLEQQRARERGDEESMHYDADYIRALEYGLPPTAGAGIGVDRLTMLLCNAPSIRDVILFPLLRLAD